MTGLRFTKRERIQMRGFCTGPIDGGPAPGDVGLDRMAACCTCGKRVTVTVRGMFAHHRPPVAPLSGAALEAWEAWIAGVRTERDGLETTPRMVRLHRTAFDAWWRRRSTAR